MAKSKLADRNSNKKTSAKPVLGAEDPVVTKSFPIVAIGASSGGLEAITEILKYLTITTGIAFIIVQNLSQDVKSILVSLLRKATTMTVQEVEDMDKMQPNNIYVIPYNRGIEVTDGHIQLVSRSKKGPAFSIDVLFTSLAETHKV